MIRTIKVNGQPVQKVTKPDGTLVTYQIVGKLGDSHSVIRYESMKEIYAVFGNPGKGLPPGQTLWGVSEDKKDSEASEASNIRDSYVDTDDCVD